MNSRVTPALSTDLDAAYREEEFLWVVLPKVNLNLL